ncbi:GNAT family N-acetyltransferase [Streptosporangium amethystogenes]|uniref:GNAT family N-acetyltransferase n=1 Tax=Streptosporangium amethystogenes TaxID=2002 RepID=UPI000A01DEAD|nr:GNAT family N-acetyltransferase [Streptosporangium amethystogenes]
MGIVENGQAELSGPGAGRVCLPEEVLLRGHGVVLREWEDGDLGAMVKLFDDPEVAYWTPLVSPFDPQAARAYLDRARQRRAAGERLQLAITVDGGEPAGEVLLMLSGLGLDVAEIGYSVGSAFRGRGLARGAVRVMTEFARDTVGVSRLLLEIEAGNAASVSVARSAGYRLTDAPPVPAEEKGRPIALRTWEYEGTG